MKKLLSILILFLTLIACKQATKSEAKNDETTKAATKVNSQSENVVKTHQDNSLKIELTIQEFLKQLKVAIKNNDINYIENCISFPFEHKSGGELIDSYNNYKEIITGSELFNKIEKANYFKDCNDEIKKVKYYCITYFDDILDVTFYAVKKNNQFRLVRMETPN
ncbi:hypothetical protein [Aquimarina aquimarini]|uniref:hypothetical protein n=1 Tax=Aquimarina aquimarini TaxID=1191734 RepID=UPI00131EEB0E|nr:hypothetical protein [Aquimarina aquimarini]